MPLAADVWRYRKGLQRNRSLTEEERRYVDLGIEIRTVERDASGSLVEVAPRIWRGGVFDRLLLYYVGPTRNPVVWSLSRKQVAIVLHETPKSAILIQGGEGSGKTVTLACWAVLRAISVTACFAGMTAPTETRCITLMQAVRDRCSASWFGEGDIRVDPMDMRLPTACTLQFRTVKRQSRTSGSPIQGYTWSFAGADELQDYDSNVDADIDARLRHPKGLHLRCSTATPKLSSHWRTWLAAKRQSPAWQIVQIAGLENPFIPSSYWEYLKNERSPREWDRRVLGLDVPPETAVYPDFRRETHCRRPPHIGARDVTARVLQRFGRGKTFALLASHDPGKICDVTLLTRIYEIQGVLQYWVVGEVVTRGSTTEKHGAELRKVLQDRFGIQYSGSAEEVLIIPDIYAIVGQDSRHPHKTVYTELRNQGYSVVAPAYNPDTAKPATIPQDAGIDMVNRLLLDKAGQTRLWIDLDEHGKPLAPRLVEAMENQERNVAGQAEWEPKGVNDTSHFTAALRYGLWPLEQVRAEGNRQGIGGQPWA